MKINEQSLEWWKSLTESQKAGYWDDYTKGMSHHNEAEEDQIEEIWRKETKDGSDREIIEEVFPDLKESLEEHLSYSKFHKSNQKQFKDFDSELYFKHFNKFSLDNKFNVISVGLLQLPLTVDELSQITSILIECRNRNK